MNKPNINNDYLTGDKVIALSKVHIIPNHGSYRVEYYCCGVKAKTRTFKLLSDAELYRDKVIRFREAFCKVDEIKKRSPMVNEAGIRAILCGCDPFEETDDTEGNIHFDRYCDYYIKNVLIVTDRARRLRNGESTDTYSRRITDIKSIYKCHIKDKPIGTIPIGKLKREDFYVFMKSLREELHLKYKTVQNIMQFCSQVLSYAVEEGRISKNWANTKITKTALSRIFYSDENAEYSGVRKTAYTEEESEKIIKTAKLQNYAMGVLIQFLIQTGVRREEALGFKFSDIDFEKKDIHICRSVSRLGNVNPSNHDDRKTSVVCRETLKTAGSDRYIDVNDELLDELTALREYMISEWSIENPDFCFINPDGRFIDPDSVLTFLNRVAAEANIRQLSVHELRHTYATATYKTTHDIAFDSKQLGHTNAGTTRRYIH